MNLFGLEKSESQTLSRIHVAQGKAMNQATSCRLQVEGDRCAVPFSNKHRPLSHPTNRGRNPPFSQISIKTEASTRHQISIHNPQNHRWWVDLGIRWNYGKSSNIRHQPLGQATEVFSNSWGDGPIKTNSIQFYSSNGVWRSFELDIEGRFLFGRHRSWFVTIDGLMASLSLFFPPFCFVVLEYWPSMSTSWRSISLHQRPFYFVPAVASGTKVFVRQTALFRTPRSVTWELRLILITADLPRSCFIFQVPCLSSRRQWISFPSRLLTCPALQVVMIYIFYVCIYVCQYVCLSVLVCCLYACMHAWMHGCMDACMHVCLHGCMDACTVRYGTVR